MSERKPVLLTEDGRGRLEAELHDLVHKQRPAIVERVASTRAEGDLKENFGYHDARQALGMLDGRVQTIEAMLRQAEIIRDATPDGTVQLGSTVTVHDEFGESVYHIVGQAEADVAKGLISNESPLGGALAGKRAGDSVFFSTPGGTREATVVAVG
ncbi:MAG: GreA/GreB family elongation factor [Candidatus Dormibacteria bacterium]